MRPDRQLLASLIVNDGGGIATCDDLMTPTETVLAMVIVQLVTILHRTASGARVKAEYDRQLERALRFLDTGEDPLPPGHRGRAFAWQADPAIA